MVAVSRRLWQLVEPLHAVIYFAPEMRAAAVAQGLGENSRGYFAFRSAPLGAASPALVTSVFYGFHPERVARALPSAWDIATPATVLRLRAEVVDAALGRLLAGSWDGAELRRARSLAQAAAAACDVTGRPLAASNQALPASSSPRVQLWDALTVLREHRGDGHVSSLVAAGVGPCAAHVLRAAAGEADAEFLRSSRGWSDAEWADAVQGLQQRGWLDDAGELTSAGRTGRAAYEGITDTLADQPYRALGTEATEELERLLRSLAGAVVDAGGVNVGRGLGSPWPPPDEAAA